MLSSSSTTTLPLVRPLGGAETNKQTQTVREKEGKKWVGRHELVKYSRSCHWFLMEALVPLGKAEGQQQGGSGGMHDTAW